LATTAKLRVVNLIAEHDVETDQELASEGDFRLWSTASMQHRKVTATEILVHTGGERSGLTEDPAEEGTALLRDLTEMLFVRRSVDGGARPM